MKLIQEGAAQINLPRLDKISKELPVFYNPVMKLNRDITLLLLKCLPDLDLQLADPLAGSGIRSLRILKELAPEKIKHIWINDVNTSESILSNLLSNKIASKYSVSNLDANEFLLQSKGFDYIDIDPFGTPNPFLDSAVKRISRKGMIAVTATDTAALAGSSRHACIRKYWASPMRNIMMHEIGIRILIRKVQLVGAQFEKALHPIYSYSKDHYYRVFFRASKGRQKVDELLKQHKYFLFNSDNYDMQVSDYNLRPGYEYAGPLWVGQLWDKELASDMLTHCSPDEKKLHSLVAVIAEESKIDAVGFYDLHKLATIYNKPVPKIQSTVSENIKQTHFCGWGVRTDLPVAELANSW